MLSGAVTKVHPEGLPDDTIRIQLEGTGGQSFGAFLCRGITLYLIGDANDYTGKGLSGGRIVVRPSLEFRRGARQHHRRQHRAVRRHQRRGLLRGVAGERFAVRLSGATAVVEGTGDHGCEYMTGGTVVVLGDRPQLRRRHVGRRGLRVRRGRPVRQRCNRAMVALEKVLPAAEQKATGEPGHWHRGQTDEEQLKALMDEHLRWTGSRRARELLDDWAAARASSSRSSRPSTSVRCITCMRKIGCSPGAQSAESYKRSSCGQGGTADDAPGTPPGRHRCTNSRNHTMGKITGFLEFERIEEGYAPVAERVKNYKEFVIGLTEPQARQQGARCMDCGTPFCNNGCPVNNIIPDFNDLVYRNDWKNARGARLDQQLPRVHRPHLPRALRGRLHAQHQQRPGGHQEHRARHHRPRLGRGLGAAAPAARKTGKKVAVVGSAPAWRRPSNWRAPATR
jgi:glutamate synthase domain-containing protein 3